MLLHPPKGMGGKRVIFFFDPKCGGGRMLVPQSGYPSFLMTFLLWGLISAIRTPGRRAFEKGPSLMLHPGMLLHQAENRRIRLLLILHPGVLIRLLLLLKCPCMMRSVIVMKSILRLLLLTFGGLSTARRK